MKSITLLLAIASAISVCSLAADDAKNTAKDGKDARGPKELFNDPAALFKWLDADKDGKLSPEEFQRILNVTGWPGGTAGSTGTAGPGPSASAGEPKPKAEK